MEDTMTARAALPALVTGCLALVAGLVSFAVDVPVLGAIAGLLGLAAGVASLRIGQRLDDQTRSQRLLEEELQDVRSEAEATERGLRGELEEARAVPAPGEGADGIEALTDPATGLFSESFFQVSLDSRIAAARRHLRPVAVVLIDVVEGISDGTPSPAAPHVVAEGIRMTLREADTPCRLQNGLFALLLEDTPENGAIWTVERIRRRLITLQPGLTLWAGVACYPAHAFNAEEIVGAAELALQSAREWRQDRIEVATTAAD